jgi:hypothetical protein
MLDLFHAHRPHLLRFVESKYGMTLAHLAVTLNQQDVLAWLLQKEDLEDAFFKQENSVQAGSDMMEATPMAFAVQENGLGMLDLFHAHRPHLLQFVESKYGMTLAHMAVVYDKQAVLAWLLQKEDLEDVFFKQEGRGVFTLMHCAVQQNQIEMLDLLLCHRPTLLAFVRPQDGMTLAHWAVVLNKQGVLSWLRRNCSSHFSKEDKRGLTPDVLASNALLAFAPFQAATSGSSAPPAAQPSAGGAAQQPVPASHLSADAASHAVSSDSASLPDPARREAVCQEVKRHRDKINSLLGIRADYEWKPSEKSALTFTLQAKLTDAQRCAFQKKLSESGIPASTYQFSLCQPNDEGEKRFTLKITDPVAFFGAVQARCFVLGALAGRASR